MTRGGDDNSPWALRRDAREVLIAWQRLLSQDEIDAVEAVPSYQEIFRLANYRFPFWKPEPDD
jgi:hypothetical protein